MRSDPTDDETSAASTAGPGPGASAGGRSAGPGPAASAAVPVPVHPEDTMPHAELDARARAEAAMRRIAAGGDPARESFVLANEFNDETVARIRATVRRWFRRN